MKGYSEAELAAQKRNRTSAAVCYRVRRMDAIEAYGGVCGHCGRVDYTAFMVVPRGRTRWRERFPDPPPQGARNKMAWLARHNYPEGFTLACSRRCRAALTAPVR